MASSSFNAIAPPIFTRENYVIWPVKMKAYLRVFDLWEMVEVGGDPLMMRHANPTIAQLKQHSEEDRLKDEFHGSERTRQMQALNLHREFEILRMKEDKTIKEYSDKIMKLVNQLRLLGEDLSEKRIVNKVLVSLSEKFEAKISSLEDSKDLSQLTVTELVNALQAQEQRCSNRNGGQVEGALMVRSRGKAMGHVEKFCKAKANNNEEKVAVVEEKEDCDEALFIIKITEKHIRNDVWLIDSGCSNHITSDKEIFIMLDSSFRSRAEIGNGDFIQIVRKGTVGVQTTSGIKTISNVLYSTEVSQNLLSVGQLLDDNDYWRVKWVLHHDPMVCFQSWVELSKSVSNDKVMRTAFYTISWSIWLARNEVIFKGKEWSRANVFDLIKMRLVWWVKAKWSKLSPSTLDIMRFPNEGVQPMKTKKNQSKDLWTEPPPGCL
ncbi:Uncharacterized protein TCM_012294 [Theobroma cacao]|uniref:Uncharacterized protein n=1 Tax=Theobroma cacao TaxID=3641 RepID=A0A061G1R3_THECC|nr:Uncharacterized protein TCM_012294 [Theobroma cacao]